MITEKKLSQAEIDELVRQMAAGKKPTLEPEEEQPRRIDLREAVASSPASSASAASPRVAPYDFRGAQRLSRDQIRGLASINKTFTRAVSTLLAHRLREGVSVDTSMIQQLSYPEFTRLVPNPCLLALYRVQPIEAFVILQFDLKLIFFIYDRLVGGPGSTDVEIRELSELETIVIERYLLNAFEGALAQSWDPGLTFTLEDISSNPFYLNLRADQDQLVLLTYEVRVGETIDTFNLAVPQELVERILPKSPHRTRLRLHRQPTELELGALQQRLGQAPVRVEVELGKAQMTVADLLELRKGDIITLEQGVDEPLVVKVNGLPKFEGMPGTLKQQLAVRIVRTIQEDPSS